MKTQLLRTKIAEKGEGHEKKEITYFAGRFCIKSIGEVINIRNKSKNTAHTNKPVCSLNLLVTEMFME